jgi:hypothetical protein
VERVVLASALARRTKDGRDISHGDGKARNKGTLSKSSYRSRAREPTYGRDGRKQTRTKEEKTVGLY